MDTIELMWKLLEKHPTDDTAKSGLADAYQELGDERMAKTIRWCIRKKRWPKQSIALYGSRKNQYEFVANRFQQEYRSQGHSIPTDLRDFCRSNNIRLVGKTEQEAINKLCLLFTKMYEYLEA